MNEISTSQLLLLVNLYVVLALLLFGISVRELFGQLRQGNRCNKKLRVIKFLIAIVPTLSCLALLAFGIFAMGMSHGSRPKDYQIILFILGCLSPIVLFLFCKSSFLCALLGRRQLSVGTIMDGQSLRRR